MLPTFIIGLREGLEAALIVGITGAFLGQQGRRDALRQVWIGTAAAMVICLGVGIALKVVSSNLPQRNQERLETVVGVIAVAMVTSMILWMRKHARNMKAELEAATASALATGSARALVIVAFLSVLREGFETVVFLLAAFNTSGNNQVTSGLGAVLGILCAVVIGFLLFRGGIKINLNRFFRITGIVLVVIAAGLLMTAAHTGNEAGWINFGQQQAADLSWLVRPGTVVSSLVTGVLGFQPYPSHIEIIVWCIYLIPMLVVVAWPSRRRPRTAPSSTLPSTPQTLSGRTTP